MPTIRQELNAAGLEISGGNEALHREQDSQTEGFLLEGGWHVVDENGANRGGLVSHRGALLDDEYVDKELLAELVAAELGFTYEQIRSVYGRGGKLDAEKRELRSEIDAVLLTLSREGANLSQLASALGFFDRDVIYRALNRARLAENDLLLAESA